MTNDASIPGWLSGQQPADDQDGADRFLVRSALIARSTLTEAQVSELVRTGRLTPYKVAANQKVTMFRVSDLNALFTPAPVSGRES